MSNYGIVANDYTEKLAAAEIARWNDNIKRHTLYTVSGNLQDPWGFYKGARAVVNGPVNLTSINVPFDAAVGAQASSQLFNWVPISYPASYVGIPAQLVDGWNTSITLKDMAVWGATELKTLITSTPGTFALVGTGIGAMVCSAVLREMQSGTLQNRMGDCIAATMFGSPCREEGATYPGSLNPGGAGILPRATTLVNPQIRNSDTPSWWWEMAAIDDPITTCPTSVSGQVVNVIAEALIDIKGARDLLPQMTKTVPTLRRTNAIWPTVAARLTNIKANADALTWAARVFTLNPNPHSLYSYTPLPTLPTGLPGLTSTSTYLDAALAYINLRGTTIPPR